MAAGEERVDDAEVVFRRVPEANFLDVVTGQPAPQAFAPRENDVSGISLVRERYAAPLLVARSGRRPKRRLSIVALRVEHMRSIGLDVVPDPLPDNPGHCVVPQLNYADRHSPVVRDTTVRLALELSSVRALFSPSDLD